MVKEYGKTWYLNFVCFINENRNLKTQKFPRIRLDKENLKIQIKKSITQTLFNETQISFPIICGMVKADALGVPKSKLTFFTKLEYSRGESCFLNILSINEIKFKRVLSGNKTEMEITSNKKLPSWMDYKIKNGVLSLYGTPQFYDVGILNISIINRQGVIVRIQNIDIKLKDNIEKIIIEEEKNEEVEKMIIFDSGEESSAKDRSIFSNQ